MKNTQGFSSVLWNIICVVLMIALLACQFLPFWNVQGEDVSIAEYVWFPEDNVDAERYFDEVTDGAFDMNAFVTAPVFVTLLGAVGAVLCLIFAKKPLMLLMPAAVGVLGLFACLTQPVFRLGQMWQIHLVLSIGLLAVCVTAIVLWMRKAFQK